MKTRKKKYKMKTTEQWIKEAKKAHDGWFLYHKAVYRGGNKKICIICPLHGELWQLASAHILGTNPCKKCLSAMSFGYGRPMKTAEQWIEEARVKHGNRFSFLKAEYKGHDEKICITCPDHGDFWQAPDHQLVYREPCPK